MRANPHQPNIGKALIGLWGVFVACAATALAQERPPPPALAPASASAPAPTTAGVPAPPPPPPGPLTLEQLAGRLHAMEETNRKLAEELEQTRKGHDAQIKQLLEQFGEFSRRSGTPGGMAGSERDLDGGRTLPSDEPLATDVETPVPDYTEGQLGTDQPAPGYPLPIVTKDKRIPLTGSFGPGFQFQTDDSRFRLQIHYESQVEGRFWDPSGQVPANSGFFLPRQRIFFNGNITKPIEYEFSINRGFGGVNLLNAYINLHFDDRFELRFGRFFTPLPYDQYAISNYWLPTPERSLFTTNLSLNRQFGVMGWGYLFDKRLDYAAGVFNGSRNSFENPNNAFDFVGYLNARPFQESNSLPFARFLNLGTSVAVGDQNQTPVPVAFRIGGGSANSDVPGAGTVPFLILNRDVIERGNRVLGSVHAAYFYKGLSLIGEWQYGFGSYATPDRPASTQVPFAGYYVTAGYFLTGEEVERRTRVYPKRPLIPTKKDERRGPGALEVVGRVSELHLGEQIFSSRFADPRLWSNQAVTTELGMNWYWNEYTKIYMFWLHGDFADPVLYRPGRYQKTADMFWLRFQLYF